jgi:hypothetical protein
MAANFLTSVHDAVGREYDYIIVGMYTLCSYPSLTRRALQAEESVYFCLYSLR